MVDSVVEDWMVIDPSVIESSVVDPVIEDSLVVDSVMEPGDRDSEREGEDSRSLLSDGVVVIVYVRVNEHCEADTRVMRSKAGKIKEVGKVGGAAFI
jgi:hypothetical protein